MTNLQERLFRLRTYDIKFELTDNDVVIRVDYPESWETTTPSNPNVRLFRDQEVENRYYYKAPATCDWDVLLDEIDAVVKVNREAELKLSLFNNKIEELHQVFLNEPYEKLQCIRFVFSEPVQVLADTSSRKPKKKRSASPRRSPKSKTSVDVQEPQTTTCAETVVQVPMEGPSAADQIASQYV